MATPKIALVALFLSMSSLAAAEELVLTFAGDIMGHLAVTDREDYASIYEDLRPWIATDDFTFVNLESPMDDALPASSGPRFNVHSDFVRAAVDAGVEVFSLANNHATDQGPRSIRATRRGMETFREQFGTHFSGLRGDSWSVEVFEKNGIVVGFLAATALLNRNEGAELVNWVGNDSEEFFAEVTKLRQRVDVLVLGFHDGEQYREDVDPTRLAFYQRCVAAGVDIVWGTHPHVLQPWFKVLDGRHFSLILPSMGNLVSGQTQFLAPDMAERPRARTGDGALLQVTVRKADGETFLESVRCVLLNTVVSAGGVRVSTTQNLMQLGPVEWRGYFQTRWREQQKWLTPREILKVDLSGYSSSD